MLSDVRVRFCSIHLSLDFCRLRTTSGPPRVCVLRAMAYMHVYRALQEVKRQLAHGLPRFGIQAFVKAQGFLHHSQPTNLDGTEHGGHDF